MKLSTIQLPCLLIAVAIMGSCTKSKQESGDTGEKMEVIEEISIRGEEVSYTSDTATLKGYIAYDQNLEGKRPGVIVVHEWWGHNQYVRERADMLAELGYTALALDMYGDGLQAEHPEDAGKFSGMIMSNLDMGMARFDAAMDLLKAHPTVDPEKIAAIGYCFGGSVVLTMANSGRDLDAVAAFHSGVQLPVMPGDDLSAKVLVCNGADDPFISAESVTAFKEAMDAAGADYRYIAYPGAVHGFTSKYADEKGEKFNLPLKYQKEADEASWDELQELLDSVF